MTDNEIIKSLECCADGDCRDCPYYGTRCENFEENNLSLVKRQKAEIDRLKSEIEHLRKNKVKQHYLITARGCGKTAYVKKRLESIEAKAIKEFAERLKEKVGLPKDITLGTMVYADEIDNLVKEMVGEDGG